MNPEVQFDDGNADLNSGLRMSMAQEFMSKKPKPSPILKFFIALHIAKNEKQAQKIVAVVAFILIIVAAFYFKKAITPTEVVQIKFT